MVLLISFNFLFLSFITGFLGGLLKFALAIIDLGTYSYMDSLKPSTFPPKK